MVLGEPSTKCKVDGEEEVAMEEKREKGDSMYVYTIIRRK